MRMLTFCLLTRSCPDVCRTQTEGGDQRKGLANRGENNCFINVVLQVRIRLHSVCVGYHMESWPLQALWHLLPFRRTMTTFEHSHTGIRPPTSGESRFRLRSPLYTAMVFALLAGATEFDPSMCMSCALQVSALTHAPLVRRIPVSIVPHIPAESTGALHVQS